MSADELWRLHEDIRTIYLRNWMLKSWNWSDAWPARRSNSQQQKKVRRPYPKVLPKYRNPERPSETWSGRGRQPRWVGTQLRSGMKVDDLLIARTH